MVDEVFFAKARLLLVAAFIFDVAQLERMISLRVEHGIFYLYFNVGVVDELVVLFFLSGISVDDFLLDFDLFSTFL